MTYRAGDFWRICDRCGIKVRASQTAKQWDNLIVCIAGCYEERQPQDFVRGRKDHQNVPDPRPEPADVFIYHVDIEDDVILAETGEQILTESGDYLLVE